VLAILLAAQPGPPLADWTIHGVTIEHGSPSKMRELRTVHAGMALRTKNR
jgi:hypothetical protein